MEDNVRHSARILVVDDELGMREGCRRTLQAASHLVDTAPNLTAARAQIRQDRYDLVLIDVMMPDGSGMELIDPIHEQDPDSICIIITGFATVELAVEAVKGGAYDFLPKPFTTDQLLVAVNQGLERRWLSVQAKRLKAAQEEARELSRAKEDLEKLDEVKSQLMVKVAHELRAPIAAVQSYINLILAGYVDDSEVRPTLSRIQHRLRETLELINDLLQLAHLKQTSGRPVGVGKPQPMADVVAEVTELVREQAAQKGLDFQVLIQDRPTIVADRQNLKEIWMNLISNAIKYTPKGGKVRVCLHTDGDRAIGVVQDTGIGISDEDQAHLFEEFFRTEEARASGEMGTGLGLAIVKQIVDSYHGQIDVSSRPGAGTRFTFSLPLLPPSSGAGQAAAPKQAES